MLAAIAQPVAALPDTGMGLRWKVSLLFVKARLLQSIGRLAEARTAFEECARFDVREFGIHLATKPRKRHLVVEADRLGARRPRGRARLLGEWCGLRGHPAPASLRDILINPGFPNRFNYGDGIREYTAAWDHIARCANGLHLLARGLGMDESILTTASRRNTRR